jgi:hypothetical protein
MHENVSYEYAIVRVVPSVERGECINCGVILYCQAERFLGALIHCDAERLRAIDPRIDLAAVEKHLGAIPSICAGSTCSGEIGQLSLSARFQWLVSPKSAMIQMSDVHTGLCSDPNAALERLLHTMVLAPGHVRTSSGEEVGAGLGARLASGSRAA